MMEVMEVPPQPSPSPTTPGIIDEFLQTGRTGRRNALTDEEKELEAKMNKLNCSDSTEKAGTSGQQLNEKATKESTNTQSEPQEETSHANSSDAET